MSKIKVRVTLVQQSKTYIFLANFNFLFITVCLSDLAEQIYWTQFPKGLFMYQSVSKFQEVAPL